MLGLLRSRVKALFLVMMMAGLAAAVACSGSAGDPGPRGEAGPTGSIGATGPTGPQGARGQAGPAGSAGATGATGAAGARGATGATGAAGADGENGSSAALFVHDAANNVVGAVEFRIGGTNVVIIGGGFNSGEEVNVLGRPGSVDVLLGNVTAGTHGGFSLDVNLNSFGFAVGSDPVFTISAVGEDSGRVNSAFMLVDKVTGN